MKRLFFFLLLLLSVLQSYAQDVRPEMADTFRSSGKIYVVVSVAAIVMFGLILYLITIDRKVSKLEKELKSGENNLSNTAKP
jgi:hypothetical protein